MHATEASWPVRTQEDQSRIAPSGWLRRMGPGSLDAVFGNFCGGHRRLRSVLGRLCYVRAVSVPYRIPGGHDVGARWREGGGADNGTRNV